MGSTVNSATLYLRDEGTVNSGGNMEIHGYVGDGAVTLGSDFSTLNLIATYNQVDGANHNLDVTSFVQSLVTGGDDFGGFMVRNTLEPPPTLGGLIGSDIPSNEFGTIAFRPTLTLDFSEAATVPEPTSIALLATGALGFMGYGWRRKRKLAA